MIHWKLGKLPTDANQHSFILVNLILLIYKFNFTIELIIEVGLKELICKYSSCFIIIMTNICVQLLGIEKPDISNMEKRMWQI